MDAATLKYITDRLPPDHGLPDSEIEAEYTASGGNANETLARIFERLAAADRYNNVSIGSMSYSGPILLERARYWRQAATTPEGGEIEAGSISFVEVTGLPFSGSSFYSGTELG